MTRLAQPPVALVPYNDPPRNEWVDRRNLLQVAAALQIQAVRDLGPIWKVSATVSPFLDLTDVPPGYDTIVILPNEHSFRGPYGFHFVDGSTAVGIVKHDRDWSLFASHELLEMLCDREGDRVARGPSLRPGQQGNVNYLVEVCDPCQHSAYTIDGVLVSDFVTPEYYGGASRSDELYSFTGRVTRPREILGGGYITWATETPNQEIWQAIAPAGKHYPPGPVTDLQIGRLIPAGLSRSWIDAHAPTTPEDVVRSDPNSTLGDGQPLRAARAAFENAALEASRNGSKLHADIAKLLEAIDYRVELNDEETMALLHRLGTSGDERAKFIGDAGAELEVLVRPPGKLPAPPSALRLAPPERYTEALNAFQSVDRFGTSFSDLDLSGLLNWMCYLGSF